MRIGQRLRALEQRKVAERKHVIKEADPGLVVITARAVDIERDGDLGLAGLAGDGGAAHGLIRRWNGAGIGRGGALD